MNHEGNGNWGGRLLEEEIVHRGSDDSIGSYTSFYSDSTYTATTLGTNVTDDSEIGDLQLQLKTIDIVPKTRTRRGGRRAKPKHQIENDHVPTRYTFCFQKDPWGDPLVCKSDWPHNTEIFRVFGCNLGGVSYHYQMKEWEQILGHTYDLQADVFCYSELNLNLYHPTVRDKLFEYKHKQDKNIKLHFACSKPLHKKDQFQMGGTITGISG